MKFSTTIKVPRCRSAVIAFLAGVMACSQAAHAQNWDFERGRTGWVAPPGNPAFLEAITRRDPGAGLPPHPPAPVVLGGDYWQPADDSTAASDVGVEGNWFVDTGTPTRGVAGRYLQRTGWLTSSVFAVSTSHIQFLIAGTGNSTDQHVRLEVKPLNDAQRRAMLGQPGADGFYRTLNVTGGTGTRMSRRVWDVTAYRGMQARIVIQDTTPLGYIAVDDFRFTDSNAPIPPAPPARPLWGIADTHAHPLATLAFNGIYFDSDRLGGDCTSVHGYRGTGLRDLGELVSIAAPALKDALAPALQMANGMTPRLLKLVNDLNVTPDQVARLAINGVDNNLGHRTDLGPRFNSRTHNHMPESGIRRAYDGGLRLMVAHAVETEMIAQLRPNALKVKDSVDRQIQAIKDMAQRNSAWMEVALTPAEARRIVGANKLALVLGVETDTLSGMGSCVVPTDCVAPTEAAVSNELDRLFRLGVRHLFPVHLADNSFGGSSMYDPIFDLNSWVLNGRWHSVDEGLSQGVQYKSVESMLAGIGSFGLNIPDTKATLLRKHLSPLRLPGGWTLDVNKALDAANAFNDNSKHMSGYANHNGLSPLGRFLIGKMMDLGMIIDIDHMSGKTISEALAQTASRGDSGYPLIAGHCSFRALSWPRDTHDPALVPSHKWPSEANMSNETLSQLVTRGGMVSPITVGGDVRSEGGTVANDAPGTSRSWAQAYLHAIHAMGGRNVGIATDMALNGGLGPRFGPMGAAGFDGDYPRALAASIEQRSRTGSPYPAPPNNAQLNDPDWRANFIRIVRRSAVQAQASPVRYTTPLKSWHDFRQADDSVYRYDGDGLIGDDERDAYFAIALHRSGESWTAIKQSIKREEAMPARGIGDTLGRAIDDQHTLGKLLDGRRQWIVNVAKGLDGIVEPLPKLWPADMFHGPIVQRAARDVLAGVHSSADPEYLQYRAAIQFASDLFNALDRGTNPPLTRFVTKSHEYDFNLDGFSTYGLMPDMLQDAKNSGMSAVDLAPLFRSAEDYIQLWERCAP